MNFCTHVYIRCIFGEWQHSDVLRGVRHCLRELEGLGCALVRRGLTCAQLQWSTNRATRQTRMTKLAYIVCCASQAGVTRSISWGARGDSTGLASFAYQPSSKLGMKLVRRRPFLVCNNIDHCTRKLCGQSQCQNLIAVAHGHFLLEP